MSIDSLQEKIRKTKNPTVLELAVPECGLPAHIREASASPAAAYGRFCRELLEELKGFVPAVRISFSSFALLGAEGMTELTNLLKLAGELGYYVILDAPEMLSAAAAKDTAKVVFGEDSLFPCDGVTVSVYLGSDMLKPFLPYCEKGKELFVVTRTANRSAPELQDLMTGSRLVHTAAADLAGRYAGETVGKFGYTPVGLLVSAGAGDSLRTLRAKYPRLFLLLDGYDTPKANGKNCSFAVNKYGRGAAVCAGGEISGAWAKEGTDGEDYLDRAKEAAQRMKKNLARYITIV